MRVIAWVHVQIVHLWRRLRGRCWLCGGERQQHAHACWHCSDPRLCHRCGKTRNFASSYGAGLTTIGRLINGTR